MKLQYLEADIQNFKSIQALRFIIQRHAGLYFVAGSNEVEPELESNGAGKSTLFDALCWIQFGKTPDGLRGPDLVPWGSNESPEGVLTFKLDEQEWVLLRGAKKLRLNGYDVTQERLESELGLSYDTFCNTILLAQGQPLFFDKTKGDKLQLLSDAEQLERWDERADRAGKMCLSLSRECETERLTIDAFKRQLDELKQQSAQVDRQADEWAAELAQRQQADEKKIQALRDEIDIIEPKYQKADLFYDSAQTEWQGLRLQLQQTAEAIRATEAELHEAQRDISIAEVDLTLTKEKLDQLNQKRCPTCGQPLHKELPARQELKERLKELAPRTNQALLKPWQQQLTQLEKEQKALRTAEASFIDKRNKADSERQLHGPRLSELRAQVEMLTSRKEQDSRQKNPLFEQQQLLRRRQQQMLHDIDQRTTTWRAKLAKQERAQYWSKAFRDIKLEIINELLQELQLACNLMLPQVGLDGWRVELDIERETKSGGISRGIDVRILPFGRKVERVKFESWSGGEQQRLRLIGAMALSDVLLGRAGIEPNIQIVDEPSQHISTGGVDDLVEFLAERAAQLGRVIYFADQNVIESGTFAGRITVTRGPKGTTLQAA